MKIPEKISGKTRRYDAPVTSIAHRFAGPCGSICTREPLTGEVTTTAIDSSFYVTATLKVQLYEDIWKSKPARCPNDKMGKKTLSAFKRRIRGPVLPAVAASLPQIGFFNFENSTSTQLYLVLSIRLRNILEFDGQKLQIKKYLKI